MSTQLILPQALQIENARILFPNFRGAIDSYNPRGARTFAVQIDSEIAPDLAAQGWNIKFPKPHPDIDPAEDTRQPYLRVNVASQNEWIPRGVKLVMVDGDAHVPINNRNLEEVDMLDRVWITGADVVIDPYEWVMDAGTPKERRGISASLRVGYFYIDADGQVEVEDPFAAKHASAQLPVE